MLNKMNKKTLDVIIPAYNSFETIVKTLASIAIQRISFPLQITIVNDCSNRSFEPEINLFKKTLNITEIKLDNNLGVGIARQIGLENTSGDYITYIDSDDVFYNSNSLQILYNLLVDGDNEYGYGSIIMENETDINTYDEHEGCIHGKIFSRKFLIENNIRFNKTRTSEDNSFNHICLFTATRKKTTSEIVYIYKFSNNSLTKGLNEEEYLNKLQDYADNVVYTLNNVKNQFQDDVLLYYLNSYIYMQSNYLDFKLRNKHLGQAIIEMINKMEKETGIDKNYIIENILPKSLYQ